MKNPHMPLRGDAHEVQLVQADGQTRPVLGHSEPDAGMGDAEHARLQTAQHWGADAGPRKQAPGGLVQALPQRSQTALAARLPSHAQQMLETGLQDRQEPPPSGVVLRVRI